MPRYDFKPTFKTPEDGKEALLTGLENLNDELPELFEECQYDCPLCGTELNCGCFTNFFTNKGY